MKPDIAIPKTLLWSLGSAVASALLVIGVQTAWAAASGPPKMEVLFSQDLEDIDGRTLSLLNLEYPPGAASPAHRHPAHTVVYVVSGQVESSLDDGEPIVYGPGEVWYESPMQLHATFRNPSDTEPFKAIAFMVRDTSKPTTILDHGR